MTTFLALQCSQCATMQVKQQKKSSNKWVCVVCNLKQSVLKVHARGPMARDLRCFVQEFNMSRMAKENFRSDGSDSFPPGSEDSRAATSVERERGEKKRMDWSEYLDTGGETGDDQTGDNDYGVEIITEPPPKKPKITCSKYQPKINENKPFQKNISKRKRDYEATNSKYNANFNSSTSTDERKETKIKKSVMTNGRSRWSEYLEADEQRGTGEEPNGGSSCTNLDASVKPVDELLVEEEVHPDFL
ncbi:hypothetical protein LUZ60_000408 [Juncus effusus]|nr:hypothetical protein LUZ60_000408 [Juncus effusus]